MLVSSGRVLADGPSLEVRLELLAERLEQQRMAMNIPGMAIAVVKDDELIMARGFGKRDLENDLPADEHTMFAIGSSTKAFTAALLAMLADEGKLDWDDPIEKHLPEFTLHDADIASQVTVRDTLSHRTGLNRTDLLWINGRASRAEILEAISGAELYSPFREQWHYNNIMFLAAGEASARIAGTDWDSLVAERLIEPLGMHQTNSTYAAAQRHEKLSKGYRWNEENDTYTVLPMRNIDSVAPAGSINSTVTDMVQWIRLQLNRGTIDDTRLISEQNIEQMWTSCMDISPAMGYGLGWFIHEWEGNRLIEHGGNIDGFASMVSLLPDENIGFVLLTNVSQTPLQGMSHGLVYSTLLGDLDDADDDAMRPAIDLEQYVGKYHFAPMDDDFTVLIKGDALAVDVPGQMVYELNFPDDEGKWQFSLTDQIAVSFDKDDDGSVVGMKMYQAGMTFELPREGVTRELEVNMDEVGPLLGSYAHEDSPMTMRVLIQNGRLAVDVPTEMVYELHPPDEQGRWYFRLTDRFHVTFEHEDDEPVLVMHQGDEATRLLRTGGDAHDEAPPSVEHLLELVAKGHNTAALADIERIRIVEDLRMVHQGITGTITTTAIGTDRVRQDMDLGRFGYINGCLDGDGSWTESDIHPDSDRLSAEERDSIRLRHPLLLFTDWRDTFDSVEVQPNEKIGDELAHVVRLSSGSVRRTVHILAASGTIISERHSTLIPGIGRVATEVVYTELHDVNGVKLPAHTVVESDFMGTMHATVSKVLVNDDVTDDMLSR